MDPLDEKLLANFEGKVVRKDLLHRVKKGTNVPTFVLEFLLARYCATDDPQEIEQGLEAVLSTLQENYVRPDEANLAQSLVATKGRHRFIDKVHVNYVEREKRHWAALENFNSQRVMIGERFYRENERLLEGGIWAEVILGYNEDSEEDYTFYIEDLRPIQLARFDFEAYATGRSHFTRDEWLDVILRSLGLEPNKLSQRVKFHYIFRLACFVEQNYNFVELGPRGTGKSYFFSEFSPYSTLISGGQASAPTLFYNNARKKIGLVGYWDTVAFDEVAGIQIKDPTTIQIMKDFMANGRFSRGTEVIADASLAFNGNIDDSIDQLVRSTRKDLFVPMPKEFDLAVLDRFAGYLPGWEMPKNSSDFLTGGYGFITDYLAEAFHYQFSHTNRYEEVDKRIRLGLSVEGRDEKSIKKTVSAFLKILHPDGQPSDAEFEEYVAYAVEARRRVKEQMNKRKPDDEFGRIGLSYLTADGKEVVVFCPESRDANATQHPVRRVLDPETSVVGAKKGSRLQSDTAGEIFAAEAPKIKQESPTPTQPGPGERHFTIFYDDIGYSYESIFGPYLDGATAIEVEDPFIRLPHQIQNFVRFCEMIVKNSGTKRIDLVTGYDDEVQKQEIEQRLGELKQSLLELDVVFSFDFSPKIHDREVRLDNRWVIKIGRGLDFYQKPQNWNEIGSNDLSLRKCLETKVDIYQC